MPRASYSSLTIAFSCPSVSSLRCLRVIAAKSITVGVPLGGSPGPTETGAAWLSMPLPCCSVSAALTSAWICLVTSPFGIVFSPTTCFA